MKGKTGGWGFFFNLIPEISIKKIFCFKVFSFPVKTIFFFFEKFLKKPRWGHLFLQIMFKICPLTVTEN